MALLKPDTPQGFKRRGGDLAWRWFLAAVQIDKALVEHFGYAGAQLLAHDGVAEVQADVVTLVQHMRLLEVDDLLSFFIPGEMINMLHGLIYRIPGISEWVVQASAHCLKSFTRSRLMIISSAADTPAAAVSIGCWDRVSPGR